METTVQIIEADELMSVIDIPRKCSTLVLK